jgi:hypothetical protein
MYGKFPQMQEESWEILLRRKLETISPPRPQSTQRKYDLFCDLTAFVFTLNRVF